MENRDWTNAEIYNAALEEWTGILMQLWTGIGKPLEPERLKIYRDQLKAVPLGLLELAISRVMRENTWSNVPNIGVIWDVIRRELGLGKDCPHYVVEAALPAWRPVYARALAGIYNQPTEVVFEE